MQYVLHSTVQYGTLYMTLLHDKLVVVHGILVSIKCAGLRKPFAAQIALKALKTGVDDHVLVQLGWGGAGLGAHGAAVPPPHLQQGGPVRSDV